VGEEFCDTINMTKQNPSKEDRYHLHAFREFDEEKFLELIRHLNEDGRKSAIINCVYSKHPRLGEFNDPLTKNPELIRLADEYKKEREGVWEKGTHELNDKERREVNSYLNEIDGLNPLMGWFDNTLDYARKVLPESITKRIKKMYEWPYGEDLHRSIPGPARLVNPMTWSILAVFGLSHIRLFPKNKEARKNKLEKLLKDCDDKGFYRTAATLCERSVEDAHLGAEYLERASDYYLKAKAFVTAAAVLGEDHTLLSFTESKLNPKKSMIAYESDGDFFMADMYAQRCGEQDRADNIYLPLCYLMRQHYLTDDRHHVEIIDELSKPPSK
jgi:hypothetical protein